MAQPSINGIAKSFVYPGNGTVGPIPVGQFLLIQGTSGESPHNSDLAIPGDMGSYTGFYPRDPTLAQRGVSAAWPGATGVQGEGNKMGIIINSGSLLTSNTSTPFPLVASYNFVDPYTMDASSAPAPWSSNPNGGLIFTIDLQLPTAVVTGESQVYAYGYFLLRDAATSQDFWLGASHYDHRGLAMASEYVGLDDWVGGTGHTIVNSLVSAPGQYLNDFTTSIQGSSGFQTSTWSGYKRMAWGVTGNNLINAVKSINFKRDHRYKNFSTDPANYRLVHTNFNPEVYYGGGKDFGMIALSFKNLKVLQAASILLPFYRLYNSKLDRHFYTTSVFEARGFTTQGYILEGAAGQLYPEALVGSLVPLYRLYRSSDHDYLYTTSILEQEASQQVFTDPDHMFFLNGNCTSILPPSSDPYVFHGIAGYVPNLVSCSVMLYRSYSIKHGHFYSVAKNEAELVGPVETTVCLSA